MNIKLKTQQKLQKKKHVNVCFVLDAYVNKQWQIITSKSIEEFTWIKCKLRCTDRREEMFKYHIKQHNIYSRNKYIMKPE